MGRPRNPRWLEPDEHELAIAKLLASSPHRFHLVPSTPEQRKYRAWYRRKRAARLAAAAGESAGR